MERLHYLEIQIKRSESTLKRLLKRPEANWMIKPLEDHMRDLKYEKEYLYNRMMVQREF